MDFFDLSAEEVHAAVVACWDLSGPLPVPRDGWLACPVCRSQAVRIRHWFWHERDHGTVRGRCDVSVKCSICSAVWLHGVVVPDDYYNRHSSRLNMRLVPWRVGRRLLEGSNAET